MPYFDVAKLPVYLSLLSEHLQVLEPRHPCLVLGQPSPLQAQYCSLGAIVAAHRLLSLYRRKLFLKLHDFSALAIFAGLALGQRERDREQDQERDRDQQREPLVLRKQRGV